MCSIFAETSGGRSLLFNNKNTNMLPYLMYKSVGQMKKSNHSAPGNAISKDAPGDLHEEVLGTVDLNMADQSNKINQQN